MDRITLTEAIITQLVERDDVDATNAVWKFRTAFARLRLTALERGYNPEELDTLGGSVDLLDSLVIDADTRYPAGLFG